MIKSKFAFGALLLGAVALIGGCDQSTSTPASTTTPTSHATSTTENATTENVETPSDQRIRPTDQNDATPEADQTPEERAQTVAEARAARERDMQERDGVVFSDDPDAQPRLMVRGSTTQHAGDIYSSDPAEFTFELYNAGTGDLIINGITTSCGCTTVDKEKFIDAPFSAGATLPPLIAKYKPKSVGDSSKIITIRCNDPVQPIVRLRVGANLKALADAVPQQIRPGELRAGRTHVVEFKIMSRDPKAKVTDIKFPRNEQLSYRVLDPIKVTDPNSEYALEIPVELIIPDTVPAGKINGVLDITVLATPPGESKPVNAPVIARIAASLAGDLRFTRPFARVSVSKPNEEFSFSSNLTTLSGREFTIERVEARNSVSRQPIEIDYTFERIEGAKVPSYTMTFSGVGPDSGAVRGEIFVYTSLEDEPPAKLNFTGFVPPQKPKAAGAKPDNDTTVRNTLTTPRARGSQ